MSQEHLLLVLVFGAVVMLGYAIARVALSGGDARIERRLRAQRGAATAASTAAPGVLTNLLDQVGRTAGRAFAPQTPEERSALRRRLGYAGFYSHAAPHLFSGARALLLAGGLAGGYLLGELIDLVILGVGIGGAFGYLLPTLWLSGRIRSRQLAIEHALPDALDLMVVCVEAGLTIDASMQRVGREINLAHPELARELGITHLEAQMGMPRGDAIRNLGRRTGCASIQSLAAMLIQAERFGTGIAQALRVHAESLRIKRQYAAEEMAAKTGVKMTVPLIVCIFPAMLVVVAGPAIVRIMRSAIMN